MVAVDLSCSAWNPSSALLLSATCGRLPIAGSNSVLVNCQRTFRDKNASYSRIKRFILNMRRMLSWAPRSTGSSSSEGNPDEMKSSDNEKVPFGYSRKDVLLIGLGVTLVGYGLKTGLEKRLEGLTEAELEALLEQVEEEKRGLASGEQVD